MRRTVVIFIVLYATTILVSGQTLKSKVVYKLSTKKNSFVPDCVVYKDSVDLNPFKNNEAVNQTTIIVGLTQVYRLDILVTTSDTIAYITAYTYEVKRTKPTRKERKMFSLHKVETKEEWELKTKKTLIKDPIIHSVLSVIDNVQFDILPDYETLVAETGFLQMDGHGFYFHIQRDKYDIKYSVKSLYLNTHEKLKDLKPIEALLFDYLNSRDDLDVVYLRNACYNSGSIVWICN